GLPLRAKSHANTAANLRCNGGHRDRASCCCCPATGAREKRMSDIYIVADEEATRRALQRAVPDLLICDVRLPGDDGLALLREAKAAHPDLPVIVMSAFTDVATTAAAYREGAADYLAKPFDLAR